MSESNGQPPYSSPDPAGPESPGYPPNVQMEPQKDPWGRFLVLGIAFFLVWFFGSRSEKLRSLWQQMKASLTQASPRAAAANPAVPAPALSGHEAQEVSRMQPQQQAERLLERAVNRSPGAVETVVNSAEAWRGSIRPTERLRTLITTGLNSNDLRVREAAMEVDLAARNLAKNPSSVSRLIGMAEREPQNRPYALWMLGMLANRGVERDRIQEKLMGYVRDSDQEARHWAVEGLALLGGEEVVKPLLDVLHNDPSPQVRERAACGLAESGMLTREQRMKAVPDLLNYLEEPALDEATRGWVYQALRDISGQNLANQPAAWRNWYSNQGQAQAAASP